MPKNKLDIKVLIRVFKEIYSFYPKLLPLTLCLILFSASVTSMPTIFMQNIIEEISNFVGSGDWNSASVEIIKLIGLLISLYVVSIIANITYQQLVAVMTQGSLYNFRTKMFKNMQKMPIRFFDSNHHGDIMSYYTNDIDTLRQLITVVLGTVASATIITVSVFCIMAYYSINLLLIVIVGIVVLFIATKYIGGNSAKYFIAQQQVIGKAEGFVEEIINGQKVVKVFNHEEEAIKDFDKINDELCNVSTNANKYAAILMPVLHNIGNVIYVLIAIVAGILMYFKVDNLSISGLPLSVSIVVPFLTMTRQFVGNVQTISQNLNSIIMAMAGAKRIFEIIDAKPEDDNGDIILVNAIYENGELKEVDYNSQVWAWKIPSENGFKFVELEGDIRFDGVDFGYSTNQLVLHDVSLFAKPHQKLAFVGATGAGKTTITNLINRFYDIADGKIKYDGIDINRIKKSSLRGSMSIVLQDTSLFTGTILENIRYGNLNASDQECIAASKLAGAHDFISNLDDGYNTVISGSNDSLSQGQRQLIAIARAAVLNPPVMIMDEATSSIDTRTEVIVQQGMDALMAGRTVLVIAHRLSTVQNSDAIIVLDHGRIIERGSHNILIEAKGYYYQLYTGAFELE